MADAHSVDITARLDPTALRRRGWMALAGVFVWPVLLLCGIGIPIQTMNGPIFDEHQQLLFDQLDATIAVMEACDFDCEELLEPDNTTPPTNPVVLGPWKEWRAIQDGLEASEYQRARVRDDVGQSVMRYGAVGGMVGLFVFFVASRFPRRVRIEVDHAGVRIDGERVARADLRRCWGHGPSLAIETTSTSHDFLLESADEAGRLRAAIQAILPSTDDVADEAVAKQRVERADQRLRSQIDS